MGGRLGELFNLCWPDIDFERGRVYINNREGNAKMPPFLIKDHESRCIPLPKHTLDLLIQYQNEAPEGVPYILLTEDRYMRIQVKWDEYRKSGEQ